MSTAPKKVGTQTVETDKEPWNSSYLTDLYDSAKSAYGSGSTLYTDPTSTVSYANYLQAADNQTLNTVPAATNAWQDLVGGSAGVKNSPVYSNLYDLGTGNTTQQRNLDDYSSRLSGIADNSQSAANSYANSLTDLGSRSEDAGQRYADLSTDYGSRAANSGRAYGGYLTDAASGAIDSGNQYGNTLSGYSTGAIDTGKQYGGYLSDLARDVRGSTNAYQQPLLDTAQGAYLNANPYLNSMYDTAAGAVARQYQTATAPQADSNYERSGRYGSGALANARSQNEQNLGTTLSGLASDIYGTNYANERKAQLAAAESGGKLSLAESDAARAAYDSAARAATSGYGTGLTGLSDAAKAEAQGYSTGITGLGSAARAEAQGYDTGLTGASNAGKLALSGLDTSRLATTGAANAADTGYRTGASALGTAGTNAYNNLTSQYNALNSLQTGYDAGNKNQLSALSQTGDIQKAITTPSDTYLKGSLGLQDLGQTASDQKWDLLEKYSGILGGAIDGGSTTKSPIYGKSALENTLTGAKTAASLIGYSGGGGGGAK